jgi:sugar/nucleoside kinase (ribokinase family)
VPAPEPRLPEPGHQPPPSLVLIGHVGYATDRTASGTISYVGGSGYAAAFAASALLANGTGLVTQVGEDFDPSPLRRLPLGREGVAVLPGASATFRIVQFGDGTRSFESDLGVASSPRRDLFPVSYLQARYIHLSTAPPRQQLAWLKFLRDKGCRARLSVDMFEHFVATEPDASREACGQADLIFLNEQEFNGLYAGTPVPHVPAILKYGPKGAEFLAGATRHRVAAPAAIEVDPIGAGEILAGAFLALRARGLAEIRALRHAVSAATASVSELGVDGPRVTRALALIMDQLQTEPGCGAGR